MSISKNNSSHVSPTTSSIEIHHHYLRKSYLARLLNTKKLYFKSYKLFGDPYEFPSYQNTSRIEKNNVHIQEVIGHNYFVLCLSKANRDNNTPHWDLYGARGGKLFIDLQALKTHIEHQLKTKKIIGSAHIVNCKYPECFTCEIKKTRGEKPSPPSKDTVLKLAKLKRKCFEWEEETRIIIHIDGQEAMSDFFTVDISDAFSTIIKNIHLHPIYTDKKNPYLVNKLSTMKIPYAISDDYSVELHY
jgi:hypothetical protein